MSVGLLQPATSSPVENITRNPAANPARFGALNREPAHRSYRSYRDVGQNQRQAAALLHDSTAARVGALFQLLVQDTTAQDFGLPSSAIRLRM